VTIAVGGLYHAQIIYFAVTIQIQVREGRVGVVDHLLKLLQVIGLTK
jgi:hypothetical protein